MACKSQNLSNIDGRTLEGEFQRLTI